MLPTGLLTSLLVAAFIPFLAIAASIPSNLHRRSTPLACQFPVGRANDYGYSDQSYASGGRTCVGWALGDITCGRWSVKQQRDAMTAVTQQLAKRGQFESSTVGIWTATFGLLTTAFADTDSIYFDHGFQDAQRSDAGGGAGALTYYYLQHDNFLKLTSSRCAED